MMKDMEAEAVTTKRIIGKYSQGNIGPLIICIAGIHGNEKAGVLALQKVFDMLEEITPHFKGCVIGVVGNLTALKQDRRFIDHDLNRCWTTQKIEFLRATPKDELQSTEDIEQKELIEIIDAELDSGFRDFLFVDLHTTSAHGGVFSISSDENVTKSLAVNLQVPVIVGLEKVFHGTTLNYFHSRNLSGIGFEAGQHDDPDSLENMVAAVFILLEAMGCIQPDDIPGFPLFEIRLGKVAGNLPDLLSFSYRYDVRDSEHFRMLPGFKNFQPIEKGVLIAHDNGNEVRTQDSGLILMPLYQKQGEDGFFIVKPMSIEEL